MHHRTSEPVHEQDAHGQHNHADGSRDLAAPAAPAARAEHEQNPKRCELRKEVETDVENRLGQHGLNEQRGPRNQRHPDVRVVERAGKAIARDMLRRQGHVRVLSAIMERRHPGDISERAEPLLRINRTGSPQVRSCARRLTSPPDSRASGAGCAAAFPRGRIRAGTDVAERARQETAQLKDLATQGDTNQSVATYPVRVDGQLDPGLSRWRWLVKWLLAIPHLVVLVFLWLAFAVLSLVAMVAIVCTGRYPRGIFDFNLGVLRWTWRVWFYAYGANGTDRYPPFSLGREDGYPAHLDIPYPEHLSRGLALVKWWLLAIPHYLIVGLFLGGGVFAWRFTGGAGAGGGLIGLLVLIAAVALLFTGRYPRGLFDLVLGLDRWALRVVAYAGLMTDAYPPFRLDAGPDDPAGPIMSDAATTTTREQGATTARKLGGGRIALIVVAVLVGLLSLGLLAAGAGVLAVDRTSRDANGFVMTPRDRLSTTTSAITASYRRAGDALAARGVLDVSGPDWLYSADRLGTIRVRAAAPDGKPLFVGVAPTRAVDAYLAGVGHDAVTGYDGGSPRYATTLGGRPGSCRRPRRSGSRARSAAASGRSRGRYAAAVGRWSS